MSSDVFDHPSLGLFLNSSVGNAWQTAQLGVSTFIMNIPSYMSVATFLLSGLLLGSASNAALIQGRTSPPSVKVINGSYYGNYNPTYEQDEFLGIPYAQPPLGNLRLHNPVSLNSTWEDSRNATQYGWACYGYGSDDWVLGNPCSEDCLTLNVIRPSGTTPTSALPVGVWIHGGGGFMGSSRDPRYNATFIVDQSVEAGKPFIFVSINYRLHGFGYLFGTEILKSGHTNIGYRDQRLALHWIQENIAAFGGDPSKVTIWGESAGGTSVGVQVLAYNGRDDGLFRGIITQSGGPVAGRYSNATFWDGIYNNITKATNCSSASDTLACLRTVPAEELSAVFNSSVTARAPSWGPRIDGDLLVNSSINQLLDGHFAKVPMLAGQNFDEGAAFTMRGVNTTEQFLAYVRSTGLDNSSATVIAALYPDLPIIGIPATLVGRPSGAFASYGVQFKRAAAYGGDISMHAPRRFASETWARNNVTSYGYNWNVLVNGLPPEIGATHFQEVAFVYYNLEGQGYDNAVAKPPFEGKPDTYKQLAKIMCRSWISFIVDGDPNSSLASNVAWPVYNLTQPEIMIFDANVTNLAYVELDTYRAEGIKYISDRFGTAYGR